MTTYTFAIVCGRTRTTHTVDLDRSIIWSELATHAAKILRAPRLGPVEWLATIGDMDVYKAPGSQRTFYEGQRYPHPVLLLKSQGVGSSSL